MLGLLNLVNQANALGLLNHHAKKVNSQKKLELLAPPLNPRSNDVVSLPDAVQGYYSGPNMEYLGDAPNYAIQAQQPQGNYPMPVLPQTPQGFYDGFPPTSYTV